MSKKEDLNDIFSRLRAIETSRAEDSTVQKAILSSVQELAARFTKHDEKEMAKYDKYDEHLQEVNTTLTKLSGTVDSLVSGQKSYKASIDQVETKLETKIDNLEATLATDVATLFTYANRMKGVGISILAAITIVWSTLNYIETKTEEESTLKAKIAELEANQKRNYDRSQMEKRYSGMTNEE